MDEPREGPQTGKAMNRRLLIGLFVVPLACGSTGSNTESGSGGSRATGGTSGETGGSPGASGGATGTGGRTTGTGGSVTTGTGGATATGGTTGTGGATATGGVTGTGGTKATGGTTGTGGATATGGTTGTGGATSTGGATGTGGASAAHVSVLQHHNDLARDGVYVDAALTQTAVAGMAIDTSFANATVTGNTYAQPLYLAGTGGSPDEVIVATEMNNVYAFNAATGAQIWMKQMGTPVSHPTGSGASGDLPCGGITPNVGITGTPVIDGTTRTIYLDAFQVDTSGATRVPEHMVHALDAATGTDRTGWPVNLNNTASNGAMFTSSLQNQRAALTLVGGKVFVPFSGHIGDCGGYHGWVMGVTTTGTPTVTAWASRAVAGGVWGASGIASDGTSLFFATGNTKASATSGPTGSSPATWGDGETVYKFPTTLVPPAMTTPGTTTDYFVPSNWASLDSSDSDIGGTSPVLVNVAGATPSSLIVALGKDKNAYLLNRTNLGGMDANPIAKVAVSNGVIINAAATYTTSKGTYVVFKGTGVGCPAGQSGALTTIKITAANPPAMSIAWCGGPSSGGSPAVSQTDTNGSNTIVWSVGSDNKLYGVDGDTGTKVVTTAAVGGTVQSIETPIVANGHIFVAANTQTYAFKP